MIYAVTCRPWLPDSFWAGETRIRRHREALGRLSWRYASIPPSGELVLDLVVDIDTPCSCLALLINNAVLMPWQSVWNEILGCSWWSEEAAQQPKPIVVPWCIGQVAWINLATCIVEVSGLTWSSIWNLLGSCGGSRIQNIASTGRTALLPFKPRSKAMEVEDMSTR
jgi:hypothetical protein